MSHGKLIKRHKQTPPPKARCKNKLQRSASGALSFSQATIFKSLKVTAQAVKLDPTERLSFAVTGTSIISSSRQLPLQLPELSERKEEVAIKIEQPKSSGSSRQDAEYIQALKEIKEIMLASKMKREMVVPPSEVLPNIWEVMPYMVKLFYLQAELNTELKKYIVDCYHDYLGDFHEYIVINNIDIHDKTKLKWPACTVPVKIRESDGSMHETDLVNFLKDMPDVSTMMRKSADVFPAEPKSNHSTFKI